MKLSEEIKQAKEDYIKHGVVVPMFIFYAGEERWIMPFDGGEFNRGAKYAFSKKAMLVNLALDCHAYTFISEIWYRTETYKKGDKIDPIIEDKPDRIEGILLMRESYDHKEGAVIEIIRQGEEIELRESNFFKEVDIFQGRFSNLLPPRNVRESISENTKEFIKDFIMTEGALQRG